MPAATAGDRVMIFDTTLRDGEQSPGCSMTAPEKVRIASALAEMGVDVIEAGFPAASPGDFDSVREIARRVSGPVICGLARCLASDIDAAGRAVAEAEKPRIHVFLATSAIHREFKLRMAQDEIIRRTREGVAHARSLCENVEFSPEDATRTEPEFLAAVVEAAIEAGATTLNIPDTVGYAVPEQYRGIFEYLRRHVRGAGGVVFSAHCHDDLGMAVANSLAAVCGGARQVECTINGIGERAGNAALEEIVMALHTRSDAFGVASGVNTRRIYPVSRLVATVTGSRVQANKAIVGDNAFAHESGIHQHGVLRNRATYEIMKHEDVGLESNQMVLGKHSGRAALKDRIGHLGFEIDDEHLASVFEEFKRLADRKKTVCDADIEALVIASGVRSEMARMGWTLAAMQVTSGTSATPTASVTLGHADGRSVTEAAVGDGPVDAVFKAIERATGVTPVFRALRVNSVTAGEDAQGEVIAEAEHGGRPFRGRGVSTDIIEASAHAFIDVINRIERAGSGPAPVKATSLAEAVMARG